MNTEIPGWVPIVVTLLLAVFLYIKVHRHQGTTARMQQDILTTQHTLMNTQQELSILQVRSIKNDELDKQRNYIVTTVHKKNKQMRVTGINMSKKPMSLRLWFHTDTDIHDFYRYVKGTDTFEWVFDIDAVEFDIGIYHESPIRLIAGGITREITDGVIITETLMPNKFDELWVERGNVVTKSIMKFSNEAE